MGILDGDLAKAIYAGFKNKLLTGELRRESPSSAVDEYGDPVGSTITYYAIQGFTSRYTEYYMAQAGIPDTDLKVCIFAQSSANLTPNKDDKVTFQSRWYQLRKVNVDPATALWVCQAFEIDPPVDAS